MDALVALFTSFEPLAGVPVRDGASVSQARLDEVLSVGYTGAEDGSDAEAVLGTEGMGSEDREQFTIRCAVAAAGGSTDLPAIRRRAYELLQAAGAAIAANRTLNGAVMRAVIGSHSLQQDQTDKGAQAVIVFTVDCDAYTGR
jgi:hypothetical protein